MAEPDEQKKLKPVNTFRPIGWPEVALKLGALIISKNLLLPFGVMVSVLLLVWKLDSKDLHEVLDKMIDHRWFAVGGWVMFAGSVYCSIRIVRWQSRLYRERINELKTGSLPSNQPELLKLDGENGKK